MRHDLKSQAPELEYQRGSLKFPNPSISSIKHRAVVSHSRTSIPSARHPLDRRSEIPRLLAATGCRWAMSNSFQRLTRDGGFLNSVPIPGPFGVPSEAPRKGTKHQLPLGVAHGASVENPGDGTQNAKMSPSNNCSRHTPCAITTHNKQAESSR